MHRGAGGPLARPRLARCPQPTPTDRQVASVVEVDTVALLLPTTAAVVAAVATVALGAPAPTASELSAWTDPALFFLLALLVPRFGPWEEPGFRGSRALEIDADPFGARGKPDRGGDHRVLAPAALPPR